MTRHRWWTKQRKVEFLIGGGLLLLTSLAAFSRITDPLEYMLLDIHFRLRPPKAFPSSVAMIGVDEQSLDSLGQWPWPRDHHAALVGLLRYDSFRPSVVGYDLLFENRSLSNPKGDLSLVYQIHAFERPFITAYFFEKGNLPAFEEEAKEQRLRSFALPSSGQEPERLDVAQKASIPYDELSTVSELAFVNTPMDPDGKTRHAQLLIRYQGKNYPSMDLLIALHALGGKLEDVKIHRRKIVIQGAHGKRIDIPINAKGEMLINFYASSRRIPAYSFVQILNAGKDWMSGGESPAVLRALKDKVVIVGVTALGLGDRRVTPLARYETGASLHAQAIANILSRDFLVRAPDFAAFLLWFLLGALTLGMTLLWHIRRSLPSVLLLAAAYFFVTQIFFLQGLWLPYAGPFVVIWVVFVGVTSFRYFTALEELKKTQQQLIQSAKMAALGELSSGMAHEFRNILHSINLHVEYAARADSPPERVEKSIQQVKGILHEAMGILNGLLTFARKSEPNRKPGLLQKTLRDSLLIMEKDLTLQSIQVVEEIEDLPEILFDPGQLSQVLINLIRNSRDALEGREDKKIWIRLRAHPNGAVVEIADNGPGLAQEVMKNLFQPFVTTKPEGKGTGLGLSVCHGIIQNHGGEITVQSTPGKGVVWSIFLPR